MFFTRLKQVIKTCNLLILYNLTYERQDLYKIQKWAKIGPLWVYGLSPLGYGLGWA